MHSEKLLLTRICDSQLSGWNPTLAVIDQLTLCKHYQWSYEEYGTCPPDYIKSETSDLCYRHIHPPPGENWEELCLKTGGSSLSFLDLNANEQYSILQELLTSHEEVEVNIGLPAKNKMPSKQISSEIDYKTNEVELQWLGI